MKSEMRLLPDVNRWRRSGKNNYSRNTKGSQGRTGSPGTLGGGSQAAHQAARQRHHPPWTTLRRRVKASRQHRRAGASTRPGRLRLLLMPPMA